MRGSLRGPVRRLGIFWKVAPEGAGPPESERKGLPGREGPSRQHRRRRSQRPACAQGRKRLPPEGAESARSQRLPPSLVQSGAAGTGTSQGQERQHPQRAGPGGWPFLRSGLGVTLRSRAGPRLPQPPTRLGEAAPPPQGRPPGGSGGGNHAGSDGPWRHHLVPGLPEVAAGCRDKEDIGYRPPVHLCRGPGPGQQISIWLLETPLLAAASLPLWAASPWLGSLSRGTGWKGSLAPGLGRRGAAGTWCEESTTPPLGPPPPLPPPAAASGATASAPALTS